MSIDTGELPRCTCGWKASDPEIGCECGYADWATDNPDEAAHARAMRAHPSCEMCICGLGTLRMGPSHCSEHDRHCTAEACGW